jgi:hypothetical protein
MPNEPSAVPENPSADGRREARRGLYEAGIRMSTNQQEHFEFINTMFRRWNDKNGNYTKRSVIENLGFYATIQEHSGFSNSALKLQAALLKMYRKKNIDFEAESGENPGDEREKVHDKGVSTRFKKTEKLAPLPPPQIDLDVEK